MFITNTSVNKNETTIAFFAIILAVGCFICNEISSGSWVVSNDNLQSLEIIMSDIRTTCLKNLMLSSVLRMVFSFAYLYWIGIKISKSLKTMLSNLHFARNCANCATFICNKQLFFVYLMFQLFIIYIDTH